MRRVIAVLFVCAAAACAQDRGERVNVPLTDPSRPARIHAQLLLGGIVVRGANTNEVVVEMRSTSGRAPHEPPVPPNASGMHRIDVGGLSGLDIVEQDNLVNIKTTTWNRRGDLVITVPRHSSLQLKTINDGAIDVEQVDGEIDADALNGRIVLKNVSGSVLAHALNGEVTATLDQVDSSKPMAFSTLNGDIDVTLPDNVRANVRMKTDNGEIYSDFDIKLDSGSQVVTNGPEHRHREGQYHIRLDKTIHGTINGGGPDYQFTSLNGQIFIRKRK
jgi:DUF4097 and DUF4098 domain-containing protein YvlB